MLNSAVLKSLALFLFLLIIISSLLSWSAILLWYWLRTFSLQNSDFSLDALHNQWKKCLISRDDDLNVSHICLVTLTEIASQLWSERDIKQQQNSRISQWNQRSVSLILIDSDHYMSVWLRSQRSCNSIILMTWSEYDDLSFCCELKRTQCLWLVAEISARRFRQQQQQLTWLHRWTSSRDAVKTWSTLEFWRYDAFMYSSIELSSLASVTMPGFELVIVMISAVLRLSHASLRVRRSVRRNIEIIQLAVAIRLDDDTRSRRRQKIIECRKTRF